MSLTLPSSIAPSMRSPEPSLVGFVKRVRDHTVAAPFRMGTWRYTSLLPFFFPMTLLFWKRGMYEAYLLYSVTTLRTTARGASTEMAAPPARSDAPGTSTL